MLKSVFSLILFVFSCVASFAQSGPPENWFNLDPQQDKVMGVSTERTYQELLTGKKSQKIVVAIIDSGVDAEHEDLKDVMWINSDETPGNGIDDDGNGYIDDVHGWNFIGGRDGNNVHHDTYEVTRLYGKYKYKYENADRDKLTKKQQKEYDTFIEHKKVVDSEREKAQKNLDKINETKSMLTNAINSLAEAAGGSELNADIIDSLERLQKPELMIGINVYKEATLAGEDIESVNDMKTLLTEELKGALDYYGGKLDYAYNPDYNTRLIVGDDYSNHNERDYGNNDVEGPDAFHGTHVAGIVAASRSNSLGMMGVADNVAIMSVRTVPDGDERDKDVANAIRYAVDNGASVINMSFGKGQSWNKQVVDEAVQYAAKHDVLMVHAAGNSHQNNDVLSNFPNDRYEKKGVFCKKRAENWVEVGALSFKTGEDMLATFSNYGKKEVDLFAPGVAIYSTIPNDNYKNAQGTSMASPVTAGVAAVLRSYFPDLSAEQVKDILMESVVPIENAVKVPGENQVKPASELSVSGGVVNLYKAVQLAEQTKPKNKNKKGASWKKYDREWKKIEEKRSRA